MGATAPNCRHFDCGFHFLIWPDCQLSDKEKVFCFPTAMNSHRSFVDTHTPFWTREETKWKKNKNKKEQEVSHEFTWSNLINVRNTSRHTENIIFSVNDSIVLPSYYLLSHSETISLLCVCFSHFGSFLQIKHTRELVLMVNCFVIFFAPFIFFFLSRSTLCVCVLRLHV